MGRELLFSTLVSTIAVKLVHCSPRRSAISTGLLRRKSLSQERGRQTDIRIFYIAKQTAPMGNRANVTVNQFPSIILQGVALFDELIPPPAFHRFVVIEFCHGNLELCMFAS